MLIADLKQNPDATLSVLKHSLTLAQKQASKQLKSVGIEDASDLAASIGYLLAAAYGVAMVLNLTATY